MRHLAVIFSVTMCMSLLACVSSDATDDTEAAETGNISQDVVSGVFTITMPPSSFVLNQVGVLDTGPVAILDGSVWLSAMVSLHCSSSASVLICARESDPSAPAISTIWCTPISPCTGDATYNVPMSAFTADAHHVLSISVQRGTTTATLNNAVLTAFSTGG